MENVNKNVNKVITLVLWTYPHPGQKSVHAGDGIEEHIGGKIIPDFQATQDVRRAVSHPAGDGARAVVDVLVGVRVVDLAADDVAALHAVLGFEF